MSSNVSRASHEYYSQQVRTALGKSVEGFIEAGQWLAEAQEKLKGDGYKKLLGSLNMHEGTARKLRAISGNEALRAHAHALPPHWTALYELTQLPADQLSKAIEAGTLTPESDRKAVKKLVESTTKPAGDNGSTGQSTGQAEQASESQETDTAEDAAGATDAGDQDSYQEYEQEQAEESPVDAAKRQAQPIQDSITRLDRIRREVEELAGQTIGRWLPSKQAIQSDFKKLTHGLRRAKPTQPCPYCGGEDEHCEPCGGLGAVPKHIADQAPEN